MASKTVKQGLLVAGAIAAAAALIPTAAGAATGSLINIVDPANASQSAHVANGRLLVNATTGDLTALLYRTPVGAVSVSAGTTKHLANVTTAGYRTLRIVADERVGSVSNVTFRVTILEGSELVARLATFTLSPHSERTFTVEVPSRAVSIDADSASGSGNNAFDFLVYGAK